MSISKKILDEIERCDATEAQKQLILQILDVEDKGTYQYAADYERLIKEYLAELNGEAVAGED